MHKHQQTCHQPGVYTNKHVISQECTPANMSSAKSIRQQTCHRSGVYTNKHVISHQITLIGKFIKLYQTVIFNQSWLNSLSANIVETSPKWHKTQATEIQSNTCLEWLNNMLMALVFGHHTDTFVCADNISAAAIHICSLCKTPLPKCRVGRNFAQWEPAHLTNSRWIAIGENLCQYRIPMDLVCVCTRSLSTNVCYIHSDQRVRLENKGFSSGSVSMQPYRSVNSDTCL